MKRLISFLLVLTLCVSGMPVVPLQAWATETEEPETSAAVGETLEATEATAGPAEEEPLPTIPPTEATTPDGDGSVPAVPQVVSTDWTVPHKYEYIINRETLDTTGCTLTLTYDDGHQEFYDINPKMVTGFDNTVLGPKTLVATCNGHDFWFEVVIVEEPKPQDMYFTGWDAKNTYLQGEPLDLTGGELRVNYSDGSQKTVPVTDPDVIVSGYDPNLLGQQIITIGYQGLTTEFYVTVSSYTGKCGDNLDYVFDEATDTLTITGSGAMYDECPWAAFAGRIQAVELPETLTALGKGAFWCCYNLNSINLPDGITSIPDGALEECRALTSLEIPDSVTHIGHYAFSGAGLTELDLPDGLETIDNYAFMSCGSLKEIVLPESLKNLGGGAFYYCRNLETVNIPETLDTISWYTFNECISLKNITIPKSVTEISYWAFNSCTALNNITFEGSAPGVDTGLFGNCYPFDNVTSDAWYPDGDTTWTQSAMQSMGGSLNWRALPASASILTFHDELNGEAFTLAVADGDTITDAPALREVAGYHFIGWYTGRNGSGEQLLLGETVWHDGMPLNYYAYYEKDNEDELCSLSVYIRYYVNGVQKNTVLYTKEYMQAENMFRWLSDNTDEIRAAIPALAGSDAYQWNGQYYDYLTDEIITAADFIGSGNKSVYVKAAVDNVAEAEVMLYVHRDIETAVSGIYAMSGYIVGEVVPMHAVRDVVEANYAGSYTSIQGMYTEDDWMELLNGTDNGGVNSILIQDNGVTKIHVVLKQAVQSGSCGDNLIWSFDVVSGKLTISGSGAMYDYDWDGAPWKPHAEKILKVELPDTLTALGSYAFDGCVNLKELHLPEGIPAIPKYALNRCESLTSLTIPKSVKVIGDTAFSECNSLTSLVLPEGVETVENFAFSWNTGLKEIVLPESLKTLNGGAFDNCSALESVNIPDSISIINWNTFGGCTSLKKVVIPKSVTEIVYAAFGGSGLETVTFEGSAPYVADHVFKPFDGVTADAWYPSGDASWTSVVMQSMGGNLTWRENSASVDPVYPIMATVKIKVNVREEPSIYAAKLMALDIGTRVEILEITTVNGTEWARIDQGWVTMQYLEISASGEVTSGTCGDNLTWTVDKDAGTLTISGTGDMYDYNVNTSPWYHLRDAIKHLIFEPGVTGIGDYAFFSCGNLETVSLMANVSRIGDGAFGLCRNLQEITLPDGLTTIGYGAFEECNSLTSIRIPEKVTVLEDQTFFACFALRNIELPQTLTRIGWETFFQCESLESIILPFGLTEIPEQAFAGCLSLTSITIPDSVTDIGAYAFEFCSSLSSIKVGKNVANIHRYAFSACDTLNEIVFTGNAPISDKEFLNNITAIAYYPANDPTWTSDVMQDYGGNITWVPYGEAVTSGVCGDNLTWEFDADTGTLTISGYGAMYDFNWETRPWNAFKQQILTVELPEALTSLGENAFGGCHNLTSINLPDGITSIPDCAFGECSALSGLVIPDSVKHIGEYALDGCRSLTSLVIPDSVETVEFGAFYGCNGLKEIVLPDSIKELGACAFKYCSSLETVKLSEALEIIHYNTFRECTSLKKIDIPGSVTEIAYWSFADCTALEAITFAGSAPQPAYGNDDPHFAPFRDLTADAWYPAEDPSWTDETMQRLGRDLNWIPVGTPKNCIIVDSADLGDAATAWVDGMEYPISYRSGSGYIFLPGGTSKTMVVHTYHVDDPNEIHTQYPVSMKVWTLENTDGVYTATRQQAFDDILQYSGMSIRNYGKKGIRMITSMEQSKKNALTGGGLAGFTLKEYGTVIAWADQLSNNKPLVLGKSYVRSNYAYKRDVADPVFQYTGSLMQYTNVLVNFTDAQCSDDIAMRPYMILENDHGEQITLYGGIVYRSIGYIAYQNRNVFEPGTEEYEYIWDIIHSVYGSIYDDEYRKVWTPPAM